MATFVRGLHTQAKRDALQTWLGFETRLKSSAANHITSFCHRVA